MRYFMRKVHALTSEAVYKIIKMDGVTCCATYDVTIGDGNSVTHCSKKSDVLYKLIKEECDLFLEITKEEYEECLTS